MLEIVFAILTIFAGLFLYKILQDYKNSGKKKKTVVSMMTSIVLCVLFSIFSRIFSENAWILNASKAIFVLNLAFCSLVFFFSIVTLLAFKETNNKKDTEDIQ